MGESNMNFMNDKTGKLASDENKVFPGDQFDCELQVKFLSIGIFF